MDPLPNGAGTTAVRRIVYFDAHAITGPVLVVTGWAVAGAVIAVGAAALLNRRRPGPA